MRKRGWLMMMRRRTQYERCTRRAASREQELYEGRIFVYNGTRDVESLARVVVISRLSHMPSTGTRAYERQCVTSVLPYLDSGGERVRSKNEG